MTEELAFIPTPFSGMDETPALSSARRVSDELAIVREELRYSFSYGVPSAAGI